MYRWIAVTLSLAVAAFFYGRHVGVVATEAQYLLTVQKAQQEAIKAAELASRKEADRLAAETARANLVLQLEDLARAEPPAPAACLPLPRVLRLNSR